jgi:sporulation protein YlmC with PRC-barrel domain
MENAEHESSTALENLNDSELVLENPALDIRGRTVLDRHGLEIGHVSDLFVDAGERKVRMLQLRAGGFAGLGERHFLLPVDAIVSVEKHTVRVNETRERVLDSPAYDPTLLDAPTPSFWEPYYGYYGLLPYWGFGYAYPIFPSESGPVPPVNAR